MNKEKYTTSKIAEAVGCHPNTVRLYEQWGFIPKAPRSKSNYRLFQERHLDHMILAWSVLHCPYPGRKIKRSATRVVKKAAAGDYGGALELAYGHMVVVQSETAQANAAATFLERWEEGTATEIDIGPLKIGETASMLEVSTDMLRNWENNGLIQVQRAKNGYRQYGSKEIGRLRVIRMLVRSGYSMMAILRMLLLMDHYRPDSLRELLDTPRNDDDLLTAADQWLSTLDEQKERAQYLISCLHQMIVNHGANRSEDNLESNKRS